MERVESLLERRVRRFRRAAYGGTALLVAGLAWREASWVLGIGAGMFALFPHVQVWAARVRPFRLGPRALQAAENVATPAGAILLGLPLVPVASVVLALLTGNVAQAGFRCLVPAIATLLCGVGGGLWLAPHVPARGDVLTNVLSLCFMAAYTTPLCALGFEETMKMFRAREELRNKTAELERLCARLSRYLAPAVYRRIVEEGAAVVTLRRVHLVVCFIDLADFTGLTERLAPEELAVVLNDFLFEHAALAAHAGGTVDKFLGDGLLVYFGDPTTCGATADVRACVGMALRLPALLAALADRWRAAGIAIRPGVRVGIASGFCTLGDFGDGARLDHTVVGRPVNVASRLKDEARVGEILLTATLRELAGDLLEASCEARSVRLKGIVAPVEVVVAASRH